MTNENPRAEIIEAVRRFVLETAHAHEHRSPSPNEEALAEVIASIQVDVATMPDGGKKSELLRTCDTLVAQLAGLIAIHDDARAIASQQRAIGAAREYLLPILIRAVVSAL